MKKLSAFRILALAAAGALITALAAPTQADQIRPFDAGVSGPITLTPTADATVLEFSEVGWPGNATHLGAVEWNAHGFITITGVTPTGALELIAHAAFTFTAANGDTIEGSFQTEGTFDPGTGVVNTTGVYDFTSGTGRFLHVTGHGTAGASGTAANTFCPLIGWIQYPMAGVNP